MVAALDTRTLFAALVALVALARLVELRIAKRNTRRLRDAGAIEVGEGHYPWMVFLHTAFLFAAPLEVFLGSRPWIAPLGLAALALFAVGMLTRYWVIRSLGGRWTTRVLYLPGAPLVRSGPYRFLRHPNYLAVALEIAALPLVHSAWMTAIVFSALNAWLLSTRIDVEDRALERWASDATAEGRGR